MNTSIDCSVNQYLECWFGLVLGLVAAFVLTYLPFPAKPHFFALAPIANVIFDVCSYLFLALRFLSLVEKQSLDFLLSTFFPSVSSFAKGSQESKTWLPLLFFRKVVLQT